MHTGLPFPSDCVLGVCSRPCGSDLRPKLSCSSQSDGKIVFLCTNKPCHEKTNAHRNLIETLLAFDILICNQSHLSGDEMTE